MNRVSLLSLFVLLAVVAAVIEAAPQREKRQLFGVFGGGQQFGGFNQGFNGGFNQGFNGGFDDGFNGGFNGGFDDGFNGGGFEGFVSAEEFLG